VRRTDGEADAPQVDEARSNAGSDSRRGHEVSPSGPVTLVFAPPTGRMDRPPQVDPNQGTPKLPRLKENVAAASVALTAEDLRQIEGALSTIQVRGDRYPAHLAARAGK
jgi:hypothetical protein